MCRIPLRWWIISLVTLGTILNYLARSTLSVAAPTLKTEFAMTTEQYAAMTTAQIRAIEVADMSQLETADLAALSALQLQGLSTAQVMSLLEGWADLNFVGMDCVEVSPPYDHAELTSQAAAHFVWTYLSARVAQGLSPTA